MSSKKIINSIQFLRGVAALAVVIHHTGGYVKRYYPTLLLGDYFGIGFAGVDLFFVISGFIIYFTSKKYLDNPNSLREYFKKRIIRVYPIYWIFTTVLFVLSALITFVLQKNIFSIGYPHTFSAYLQTYTLFPLHFAINPVTWTLSFELFFYLCFALLIIDKRLWVIHAVILGVSLGNIFWWNTEGHEVNSSYFNFIFSGYNFEFLLGFLIGKFYEKINLNNLSALVVLLIGIGVLLKFGYDVGDYDSYQRLFTFGVPSGLIVLALLNLEKNKVLKIPSWGITLGDASYALYLIHFPMMLLLNKIPQILGYTFSAQQEVNYSYFIIFLIVISSLIIHKFIEKPLSKFLLDNWK
jgi:peptidoglycan/LPS O-acetylase OafA/YrhL